MEWISIKNHSIANTASRAAVGAMFIVLIGVHCAGRNWIFNTSPGNL